MNRVEPNRNVYVGHRYVPLLVGEWDKSIQYEGLSIVTFKGASYTSKKMTPPGIDIENEEYWVVTGNYDAQVEYYRLETKRVSDDLAQAKIDLNKRIDDTVEYVDTNVEDLTIYVNDEVRKNSEYVDSEVLKLTGYVNDEISENRDFVTTENEKTVDYVDGQTSETRQYVEGELSKKANGFVFRYQRSGLSSGEGEHTENSEDPLNTIMGYKDNAVGVNMRGVHIQQGSKNNENIVGGDPSTINKNEQNIIDPEIDNAHYAVVGGYDNVNNALAGLVISMHSYIKDVATHGSIYGGSSHELLAGDYSGVFGGYQNIIDIAEGGGYGFIGGGNGNKIHGKFSSALGGFQSRIGNSGSFKGKGSFIGTGESNTIDGDYASISAGLLCKATKDFSIANGHGAVANNFGERTFSNGYYEMPGDRGKSEISMSRITEDNMPIQLLLDGENVAPIMPTNGALTISGLVTGIRTDVKGESISFKLDAHVNSMSGEPVIESKNITAIHNDGTYDVDIVASNDRYEIRVTGMVDKTIRWHGDFKTVWLRDI